jgi:hypothetical protein
VEFILSALHPLPNTGRKLLFGFPKISCSTQSGATRQIRTTVTLYYFEAASWAFKNNHWSMITVVFSIPLVFGLCRSQTDGAKKRENNVKIWEALSPPKHQIYAAASVSFSVAFMVDGGWRKTCSSLLDN